MSRRTDILAALDVIITAVAGINTVEVNRVNSVDSDVTLPACIIRSGPDELQDETSSLGREEWEWDTNIELITQDDNLETLLGLIHVAMMADNTLGGLVDRLWRSSSDLEFLFDLPSGSQGLRLVYKSLFELAKGAQ